MDNHDWEAFQGGCRALGIAIEPTWRTRLETYADLLLAWNQRVNLTAIRAPRAIWIKHFLDSLTLLPHLPPAGALLDIGTGAGFPGLVLKIARPGMPVTLVEARARKVAFLEEVRRSLGLPGCTVIHRHLAPGDAALSGAFGTVVSRAFRGPRAFLQLARGFVGAGGRAVVMGGGPGRPRAEWEALAAEFGARLGPIPQFALPEGAGARHLVILDWPPGACST
ncbi:MAG: 16S rRNA (guanine(527)-N(7))-methyltransferase RsmG [Myxococcota bacterium]